MESQIEALAEKFGLSVEFLARLEEKVTDKENFARAVKMFAAGRLPYDAATGDNPINVAALRTEIARNLLARRAEHQRMAAEMRRVKAYYDSCRRLVLYGIDAESGKADRTRYDAVFVKDFVIVAFARYEPGQGGIYMADNEVHPDVHWHPHQALARLRRKDKAFYRKVRKAAFRSPREWFDFTVNKE